MAKVDSACFHFEIENWLLNKMLGLERCLYRIEIVPLFHKQIKWDQCVQKQQCYDHLKVAENQIFLKIRVSATFTNWSWFHIWPTGPNLVQLTLHFWSVSLTLYPFLGTFEPQRPSVSKEKSKNNIIPHLINSLNFDIFIPIDV